jgi:hypothetical protein
MIVYDLKCKKNHEFEGWFKDRAAFEEQKEKDLITCPVCGEAGADIVPSTVAILSRDLKTSGQKQTGALAPQKAMQWLHDYIEKNFDDVGNTFTDTALRIHHGEEEARNIRGTTTHQDEELLRDEGIPFLKIPVIKLDS